MSWFPQVHTSGICWSILPSASFNVAVWNRRFREFRDSSSWPSSSPVPAGTGGQYTLAEDEFAGAHLPEVEVLAPVVPASPDEGFVFSVVEIIRGISFPPSFRRVVAVVDCFNLFAPSADVDGVSSFRSEDEDDVDFFSCVEFRDDLVPRPGGACSSADEMVEFFSLGHASTMSPHRTTKAGFKRLIDFTAEVTMSSSIFHSFSGGMCFGPRDSDRPSCVSAIWKKWKPPVNFPSSFSVYPGTVPFGAALRRPPLVVFRLLLASTEPALALLMPRAGFASFLRTSLEVPPPPPVFILFWLQIQIRARLTC
mmetsp:Transcript_9270/g.22790  ORF Transcript_9270/g.22790 Transcript_9270/m.22790 type:complete len:310 (-) Transcript_9270:297-1226(-)